MKEIWLPIPNYEGWYEASNLGQIRRIRKGPGVKRLGQPMKLSVHKDGYVFVKLSKEGKGKICLVSKLVCTTFHGPCPLGYECNHKGKDGNKSNNRADNLEWSTHSDNCKHKFKILGHDLSKFQAANPFKGKKGALHPRAKRYIITFPNGEEIEIIGLKNFCRNNGLSVGAMFQIATGSGHSYRHKGFKCRYA